MIGWVVSAGWLSVSIQLSVLEAPVSVCKTVGSKLSCRLDGFVSV